MKLTRTIRIPYALARFAVWQRKLVSKYETNQLIRALDTWIVLKSESECSLLQNWNLQKQYLFELCKCSESVFRHRIKLLASLQLISLDGGHIRLVSWKDLGAILQIDLNVRESFGLQYNIHDGKKLYQWIIATEMADNENRQRAAIIAKVKKNPAARKKLAASAIAAGADPKRINDMNYLHTWMRIMYMATHLRESEIHALLISMRPETSRSVYGIANAWCARSAQTASYWKGILKKYGIIDISKLQIVSQSRARNEYCAVKWLKSEKQTMLPLCDSITILKPWERFTPGAVA